MQKQLKKKPVAKALYNPVTKKKMSIKEANIEIDNGMLTWESYM